MLEEIEVPPDLVQGVICLTAWACAFGTSELSASGKIDIDIELFLLRIKLTTLHQPRWKQAKGHLEKVSVLHGGLLLDIGPYQEMTSHAIDYKMTLPTHNSEEPILVSSRKEKSDSRSRTPLSEILGTNWEQSATR
jgi:hypothetical protein